MEEKIATLLLVLPLFQCGHIVPLSNVRGIYLTTNNIRYWATQLHSNVNLQTRVIRFGAGATNDLLLEVPLGHIDLHATIVVTVGLDESHPNSPGVDSDPHISISDGSNENTQVLVDAAGYGSNPPLPPCYGGSHDNRLVQNSTPVPATFRLTFTPLYRYGSCETAQLGGYINTGTFSTQIDTTKPLFLRVRRDSCMEQVFFRYFKVEIF